MTRETTPLDIRLDDPRRPEVAALLAEHEDAMAATAPAESRHALDVDGLARPGITFWCAWDGARLAGCGALKDLGGGHGELKSMRTAHAYLRRGVAAAILGHIEAHARAQGYARLSLETGSMAYFEPARSLYARAGYRPCGPFAQYRDDPLSAFMTKALA